MRLSSLQLLNFRNISELTIEPGPGFNLLVGQNAQGKTNLVEAITLLSTGHSFRAADFRDLIRWGAERAAVSAEVEGIAGASEIRVLLDGERKLHLRNGKRAAASGGARAPTVLFAPEETMLFRGTPGLRRRHLDAFIAQLAPGHRALVTSYEKVVRQRNSLLQDPELSTAARTRELAPWDAQLAELGAMLLTQRKAFCDRLNERVPLHYQEISASDGPAFLHYLPHDAAEAVACGKEAVAAHLALRLGARRAEEEQRGVTLVGPHRDDLDAVIGAIKARQHGSQGQHRSLVLALKMAQTDLLREQHGEEPILLLDDVASELDEGRNRHFFEALEQARGQVFITATSEADVRLPRMPKLCIFDVREGMATPRK